MSRTICDTLHIQSAPGGRAFLHIRSSQSASSFSEVCLSPKDSQPISNSQALDKKQTTSMKPQINELVKNYAATLNSMHQMHSTLSPSDKVEFSTIQNQLKAHANPAISLIKRDLLHNLN